MNELGLIEDGAVAVSRGLITLVGITEEVLAQTEAEEMIDASSRVVMPGFVDPHTHLVFAGSREDEFESRLRGATYMEIMAAGGGIMSTVRATRAATLPQLIAQSRGRLDRMLAHGTTTAEAKSGYGLNVDDELKMLEAIRQLDATHPVDLVPTFLGAHAVPVELEGRADEYVEVVINEMLPLAERELRENASGASAPSMPFFCDVFCEEGVFSVGQSRRILERARELGFGLKVHADEFKPLGGTRLAVELGA
ncbi:MAG: imidazolonepropionase, partial [Anaerolineae bacterium]|nr:imidazolonepropionase [Anaerolineae bacterium]